MGKINKSILSSLMKKFVMAITGFVLAAFLLVHMLGNLQTFEGGPHAINAYANFLQTLPWEFLWGFRMVLLACFVVHFLMAFLLWLENRSSRPLGYNVTKYNASSWASRYMIYTGILVIAFIILHIMQYTMLNLDPYYKQFKWVATSGMYEGKTLHDVYGTLIYGFSGMWGWLYICFMIAIALHLSHGVSSMFQSVGFRNEKWRYRLNAAAVAYCVIIAAGFSVTPAAVLISKYTSCQILPVKEVLAQVEKAKQGDVKPVFINYDFLGEGK